MVAFRRPIAVSEAIRRVMTHVQTSGVEIVPLDESAGRILAEPIVAGHDVPPFHRSPYDGFAIRSQDSASASDGNRVAFRVIEHIGAGLVPSRALQPGEATRIMTGAALPGCADAVVMFEQTVQTDDGFAIRKPFAAWENVSLQGEDAKTGEVLIEQGQAIHPGIVALLATFGYASVNVASKPVVGIISTGSELVDVDEALSPGKIRDSNGPMVAAQLARLGIRSRSYGMMKDDLASCLALVERALGETDCLITTGGVSVGDYDHMPAIYDRLGAETLFNKVAMRPGSVTTAAVLDGKLMFGLSGNPSACYIGFELFARPALLRMMDSTKPYLPYAQAILTEPFTKPNPFTRFVRAVYHYGKDGPTITPAGFNKSNAVSSLARGNALMVLPGGTRGYREGAKVDVLLLGMEAGEEQWRI